MSKFNSKNKQPALSARIRGAQRAGKQEDLHNHHHSKQTRPNNPIATQNPPETPPKERLHPRDPPPLSYAPSTRHSGDIAAFKQNTRDALAKRLGINRDPSSSTSLAIPSGPLRSRRSYAPLRRQGHDNLRRQSPLGRPISTSMASSLMASPTATPVAPPMRPPIDLGLGANATHRTPLGSTASPDIPGLGRLKKTEDEDPVTRSSSRKRVRENTDDVTTLSVTTADAALNKRTPKQPTTVKLSQTLSPSSALSQPYAPAALLKNQIPRPIPDQLIVIGSKPGFGARLHTPDHSEKTRLSARLEREAHKGPGRAKARIIKIEDTGERELRETAHHTDEKTATFRKAGTDDSAVKDITSQSYEQNHKLIFSIPIKREEYYDEDEDEEEEDSVDQKSLTVVQQPLSGLPPQKPLPRASVRIKTEEDPPPPTGAGPTYQPTYHTPTIKKEESSDDNDGPPIQNHPALNHVVIKKEDAEDPPADIQSSPLAIGICAISINPSSGPDLTSPQETKQDPDPDGPPGLGAAQNQPPHFKYQHYQGYPGKSLASKVAGKLLNYSMAWNVAAPHQTTPSDLRATPSRSLSTAASASPSAPFLYEDDFEHSEHLDQPPPPLADPMPDPPSSTNLLPDPKQPPSSPDPPRPSHTARLPPSPPSPPPFPATYAYNRVPFRGLLSPRAADTSRTAPMPSDIRDFEAARARAAATLDRERHPGSDHEPHQGLVRFGDYALAPWHPVAYDPRRQHPAAAPSAAAYHHDIYVCPCCFKHMPEGTQARRHALKCARPPPGCEVYRRGRLSVYEVDGAHEPVYCADLCYLAKLFLGSKSRCVVGAFLFYVLVVRDDDPSPAQTPKFGAYFSKEKSPHTSPHYNLSCILTFPLAQHAGLGSFMIEFSYLLSRVEGRPGTPEKPLSESGCAAYRRYWSVAVCYALRDALAAGDSSISVTRLSLATGMTPADVVYALERLGFLVSTGSGDPQDPSLPQPDDPASDLNTDRASREKTADDPPSSKGEDSAPPDDDLRDKSREAARLPRPAQRGRPRGRPRGRTGAHHATHKPRQFGLRVVPEVIDSTIEAWERTHGHGNLAGLGACRDAGPLRVDPGRLVWVPYDGSLLRRDPWDDYDDNVGDHDDDDNDLDESGDEKMDRHGDYEEGANGEAASGEDEDIVVVEEDGSEETGTRKTRRRRLPRHPINK